MPAPPTSAKAAAAPPDLLQKPPSQKWTEGVLALLEEATKKKMQTHYLPVHEIGRLCVPLGLGALRSCLL